MRNLLLLTVITGCASAQQLQFADLGECKLTSGESIQNCRIGYRTFGTLNAAKSNAVLFPTWFTGTTADLEGQIGPGKVVDPTNLFVIAVDAIGNGVSSSPSNSTAQPRMKFPQFTIRDMINSQHRLVTEKLGIRHLYAVMGISMGGMQTFEWITAYPDFMDRAVPIVGSPQLTSYDLLLWEAELRGIEENKDWNAGNYTEQPALRSVHDMHTFALMTPEGRVRETTRAKFADFLRTTEKPPSTFDANDWLRQLQAMMAHDVAASVGGDLRAAAKQVKARVLNVVAAHDHMVNPGPASRYADLIGAKTLVLNGDCGHLANGCESALLNPQVNAFLK
jgi:homoserine O-acetyltransferase